MWLIDTKTLELKYVFDAANIPYAILSHRWEDEEVSFQDFQDLKKAELKKGFSKIRMTCKKALEEKPPLEYCWVDTCCIDKSSSAELTEGINSMFQWYRQSTVCYAFLSDMPSGPHNSIHDESFVKQLSGCEWYGRGWTLQELIAPGNVMFYDEKWNFVGSKHKLRHILKDITTIPTSVLDNGINSDGSFKDELCVARKMSWAANRKTSRVEDMAYCLLGIFGINMPLIYGEGHRAFMRLQEEIMKGRTDRSIFAWKQPSQDSVSLHRGLLARSPSEFAHCTHYVLQTNAAMDEGEFSLTNKGIRFDCFLRVLPGRSGGLLFRLCCSERLAKGKYAPLAIRVIKTVEYGFVRADATELVDSRTLYKSLPRYKLEPQFYAARDLDMYQAKRIMDQHKNAIQVRWDPPDEPSILAAGPKDYWDPINDLLFNRSGSILGYVHFLYSQLPNGKKTECVLIFGRRRCKSELSFEDQPGGNTYVPWCVLRNNQSPDWDSQLWAEKNSEARTKYLYDIASEKPTTHGECWFGEIRVHATIYDDAEGPGGSRVSRVDIGVSNDPLSPMHS